MAENQKKIHQRISELIDSELLESHAHLTYREMADLPPFREWAGELRAAEDEWMET